MYMYFENASKFLESIYLLIYVLIIKVGLLNINKFHR